MDVKKITNSTRVASSSNALSTITFKEIEILCSRYIEAIFIITHCWLDGSCWSFLSYTSDFLAYRLIEIDSEAKNLIQFSHKMYAKSFLETMGAAKCKL